jgi:hypothetical protein
MEAEASAKPRPDARGGLRPEAASFPLAARPPHFFEGLCPGQKIFKSDKNWPGTFSIKISQKSIARGLVRARRRPFGPPWPCQTIPRAFTSGKQQRFNAASIFAISVLNLRL